MTDSKHIVCRGLTVDHLRARRLAPQEREKANQGSPPKRFMGEQIQEPGTVVLLVNDLSADELELGMDRIHLCRIGRLCMDLDEDLKGFFVAIIGDDCGILAFCVSL